MNKKTDHFIDIDKSEKDVIIISAEVQVGRGDKR